jgi:hypothetical protein
VKDMQTKIKFNSWYIQIFGVYVLLFKGNNLSVVLRRDMAINTAKDNVVTIESQGVTHNQVREKTVFHSLKFADFDGSNCLPQIECASFYEFTLAMCTIFHGNKIVQNSSSGGTYNDAWIHENMKNIATLANALEEQNIIARKV